MSGLDVNTFNLFAKKSPSKTSPQPITTKSQAIIVKDEVEDLAKELIPSGESNSSIQPKNEFSAEIERFAEFKSNTIKNEESTIVKKVEALSTMGEKSENSLRKFETFVAPTFRITEDHENHLARLEKAIMRNRKKGVNSDSRERITTNTIVRALLTNFFERESEIDFTNIDNESMLKERMEKIFKQKYSKRN